MIETIPDETVINFGISSKARKPVQVRDTSKTGDIIDRAIKNCSSVFSLNLLKNKDCS